MFNEITKNAIQDAFKDPRQVNKNLVDAQQTRRILDRLVGYKVSPILWKTIGGKLSAGRVQTVAVRMVVEREREIEAFVKTEYWSIIANLTAALPPNFDSKLYRIEDKTVKSGKFDEDLKATEVHIKTTDEAASIVTEAGKEAFVVDSVTTKERKRNPTPPFITSKLQQEASRKLGFRGQKDNDGRAKAVRRYRDRLGRCGRFDHLHAYRLDKGLRRSFDRCPGLHRRKLRRLIPSGKG